MKMPKFMSTKNVLVGSGIVSTVCGIITTACALVGVDSDCSEPTTGCSGAENDVIEPLDDADDQPQG